MDLVKHEIDRINSQAAGKGSLSMVFKSGGITVGPPPPCPHPFLLPLSKQCESLGL